MKIKTSTIIIVSIFIWIGFIAAISFMEAWLKFRAEGVTQSIGLSIGSLVFNALNKVEISLSIIIVTALYFSKHLLRQKHFIKLLIPLFILIGQSIYLLPILDKRVELIIKNTVIESSYHHFLYVFLEVIKLVTLLIIGIQILNKYEYK